MANEVNPTQGPREEARRTGYSDTSYRRGPRKDLTWVKRKWEQPAAQNLLTYSNYNASGWTVTGSDDAGLISIGPYADQNLVQWGSCGNYYNSYWQVANYNGVQTWTYTGSSVAVASTVDVASYAAPFCFAVEVGPNHASGGYPFTVTLSAEDGSATSLATATYGLTEHAKLWLAIPTKPTDNQLVLKITVAYSGSGTLYWWFGNAQLESGVLVPGHYVPTAGAAITYAVPTQMRGVAKVFRDEWETVQEPYDGIVTPREGQDQSSYVVPHAIDDFRS